MKKYYVKLFLSFLIFVGIFSDSFVMAGLPLAGKIIVIDVGHGGKDPGSMYKNIYEKDVNLAISLELEKSLTKLGASVILVRRGDYDLSRPNATWRKKSDFDNRIRIINTSKADYYLSIHLNYLTDKRYYGPQVFYNQRKKVTKKLQNKYKLF